MDKLRAMQVFIRIAEEGSLTAAARAMESSLPATVRTLAGLEASLGVRLFNRTTRRISLTNEGHSYLASSKDILSALIEAEKSLNASSDAPEGQLSITAPVLFGRVYVAPTITRFIQRYEKIRCSVLLVDRVVNLVDEGMDIGIRVGTLKDSSLIAQPLGHIRRVVVTSPKFLAQHRLPQHPKDLKNANCVCLTEQTRNWGPFIDNSRKIYVSVDGNLEFNQSAPAIDACAAGAGFGLFFSYQVADLVKRGQLKIILQKFEPAVLPISIVYPHARLLPARTRIFIDWVKKDLKNFQP